MQQPPDPYSQYSKQQGQQPPFQPQPYQQPSQYPPPPPPVPPNRPSGFSNWFRTRSRWTKVGLGCGTILAALLLCICAASVYGSSTVGTRATPTPTTGHAAIQNTPTHTPTLPPTPTQQPTPIPTPTQQPTPTSQPTQPPAQPTPTPTACQAVNNNPWCYNFVPGNLIYNPPSNFCDYFTCVSTFWTATSGYVAECVDGHYTHSGGVKGACSRNGGENMPLYSH